MKLWGARFTEATNGAANDFNSSIDIDKRLYAADIAGSTAHAKMLAECGIISEKTAANIISALAKIESDIEKGKVTLSAEAEDIHMNIEKLLIERIGDDGKAVHTARSRNDQTVLDLRIWVKAAAKELSTHIKILVSALADKAEANTASVMPGFTHLQPAQPVTFAHQLCAYCNMLLRDLDRFADCEKRADICPIGSCALAGTTFPTDRAREAALLGFSAPCENSMDGVSDRDFAVEFVFCAAMTMMHLSRLCEEVILWSTPAFGFITLSDAWCTGSSIMPQKKNPDIAELARGKTGRVYGDLTALLTLLKGLPLAYNKDMQEDKEAVFDAFDTLRACLRVIASMLAEAKVNSDKMRAAAAEGFINATDCADWLVGKGLPFRDAYTVTGSIVKYCIANGEKLETLPLEKYREFDARFDEGIYTAVDLDNCVNRRTSFGGPAEPEVKRQIAQIRRNIE